MFVLRTVDSRRQKANPVREEALMEDKRGEKAPACAGCGIDGSERLCRTEKGRGGKGCPTFTRKDVLEDARFRRANKKDHPNDDPSIKWFP